MTSSTLSAKTYKNGRNDPSMNTRTPLAYPELQDFITHINEEHFDALLGFLEAFTPLTSANLTQKEVQLTAIYAEGITLQVRSKNTPQTVEESSFDSDAQPDDHQTYFIAFCDPVTQLDELQSQYIFLKQKADKILGKKTIKLTQQTFAVQSRQMVSDHMLRLVLTHQSKADSTYANPIPISEPGYAYLFNLEHNFMASNTANRTKDRDRPARAHCYYTLRKAWQTNDGIQVWVDVFLHGDTSGGNWAQSLKAGDTVISNREFPEKIEHLQKGQALLIADETSLPTVARLLELWDNPIAPLVICVTTDAADQRYLDAIDISPVIADKVTVLPLITHAINTGADLASLINHTLQTYLSTHPLAIEKVWGGLEAKAAKALRPLLQKQLGLSRTDSVVKVYWRHN